MAKHVRNGLLVLRYLLDFRGRALVAGILSPQATRTDADAIASYLDGLRAGLLDIDANGAAGGMTDGLLLLRYFFDFQGRPLVQGLVGESSMRAAPEEIVGYLDRYRNLPPTLNAIADPAPIAQDAGEQTMTLSGISAGRDESQTLSVMARSDTPDLVADPRVEYASPDGTGVLSYAPRAGASGMAVITVTVTDAGRDGVLGSADDGTFQWAFQVGVTPGAKTEGTKVAGTHGRASALAPHRALAVDAACLSLLAEWDDADVSTGS